MGYATIRQREMRTLVMTFPYLKFRTALMATMSIVVTGTVGTQHSFAMSKPPPECSVEVAKARASVNKMPQPQANASSKRLTVSLELEPESATGSLSINKSESTQDFLVLTLIPDAESRVTKHGAKFAMAAPSPLYKSVSIQCEGREVAKIATIVKLH